MESRPAMPKLPTGFRFRPTDEELVDYYLSRKVFQRPLPVSIIPELDASRFNPWDIPGGGAVFAEKERFFFTLREAMGQSRPAGCGYWKPIGKETKILRSGLVVAIKKTLVFRRGKPSRGSRMDWVMHEYCLVDENEVQVAGWVLCRTFPRIRAARGAVGRSLPRKREREPNSSEAESSCVTEESEDEEEEEW